MADCEQFSVTVKDVPKAIDAVKKKVQEFGGSVSGNEKAGSFSFTKMFSKISGTYTVDGNKITIKTAIDGGVVSCNKFMAEIQKAAK
jgi:hypothetical protein